MTWRARHWVATEFACDRPESPCDCGFIDIHPELVTIADNLRECLGVPLRCSSGVRCEAKNRSVSGSPRSLHLPTGGVGYALDLTYFRPELRTPLNVARMALTLESLCRDRDIGLGLYRTWCHIDIRGVLGMPPARWEGTPSLWDSTP